MTWSDLSRHDWRSLLLAGAVTIGSSALLALLFETDLSPIEESKQQILQDLAERQVKVVPAQITANMASLYRIDLDTLAEHDVDYWIWPIGFETRTGFQQTPKTAQLTTEWLDFVTSPFQTDLADATAEYFAGYYDGEIKSLAMAASCSSFLNREEFIASISNNQELNEWFLDIIIDTWVTLGIIYEQREVTWKTSPSLVSCAFSTRGGCPLYFPYYGSVPGPIHYLVDRQSDKPACIVISDGCSKERFHGEHKLSDEERTELQIELKYTIMDALESGELYWLNSFIKESDLAQPANIWLPAST